MDEQYAFLNKRLKKWFSENNYEETFKIIEEHHNKSLINSKCLSFNPKKYVPLTINFPGLKTYRKKDGSLVYDYRVSLNGVAISHANIVLDLYNKSKQHPSIIKLLYKLLDDVERNAYDYKKESYIGLEHMSFQAPSEELISKLNEQHLSKNKIFRQDGNANWNYSLDELTFVIMWIVLQEDINYPRPRYQGRQMPFYRYVEAIALNDDSVETNYTLSDVIDRTLQHDKVPPLYPELQRLNLYTHL